MPQSNCLFRQLEPADIREMLPLIKLLNPELNKSVLEQRLTDMFKLAHYHCFGLFLADSLTAVSSVWVSTKLYSGKQAELDNVVVKPEYRGRGLGKRLMEEIEIWAKRQGCLTVELASYVSNSPSHKFYFGRGYHIIGFHFQKLLS